MKGTLRLPLLGTLVVGLTFFSAYAVSAATVTVVLESGRLSITDAPVALTYSSTTTSDNIRRLDTTFSLGMTDATGTKAGWHIQATLGALTRPDGSSVPVLSSAVTQARVTTLTGRPPNSMLSYPRAFRTDGDTIFSAAAESGMGKSSLTFDTELAVEADTADTAPLTTTLTVTITASP